MSNPGFPAPGWMPAIRKPITTTRAIAEVIW